MPLLEVKDKRLSDIGGAGNGAYSGEVMVFCPRCKAFQTVWLDSNKMMPTRKFCQEGSEVYHDCGSSQPCRLYQSW